MNLFIHPKGDEIPFQFEKEIAVWDGYAGIVGLTIVGVSSDYLF